MTRIVQIANFVAPRSGGIRTVLSHLAQGYAEAGHEVVQIVPGAELRRDAYPWGTRTTLPGVPLPGTGYRVLTPTIVRQALRHGPPDRVEVHDRATLRGVGPWCRRRGIPAIAVSHERLDRLALQWWPRFPGAASRFAARHNRTLTRSFDRLVCTTSWAADEFGILDVPAPAVVPLGVDLETFTPAARQEHALRPRRGALLVLASRLSADKQPELALQALVELLDRGRDVALAVAGDGPLRGALERAACDLPVTFLGHVPGRVAMAGLLASADVVLAPGPVETFGLAALEALACGTAVVCNVRSALPGVVGDGGTAAMPTPVGMADAVEALLERPPAERRAVARERAERFPWSATVTGFLAAHGLGPVPSAVARELVPA